MPPEADAPEAAARVRVKICGITRAEDLQAAVSAGADYVGFVFFPRSPRNVTIDAAAALAAMVPPGVRRVGLTVDASDALLGAITARVALDMLQLHGREPPARAAEVRVRYGLSVMKAVGIAGASDLPLLDAYQGAADQVLVDARPPEGAPLPGGNGLAFDWRLLAGRKWRQPWMLAGGLTPDNVAEAIRRTGVRQVDVSSGVEAAPGLKDPTLLAAFIAAAQSAAAASGPR